MPKQRANYDVTEVYRAYQDGTLQRERQDLVKEFGEAMRGNPEVLNFLASIMQSMVEKGHPPMDCVAFSLCQGMAIGVLLEKERMRRKLQ